MHDLQGQAKTSLAVGLGWARLALSGIGFGLAGCPWPGTVGVSQDWQVARNRCSHWDRPYKLAAQDRPCTFGQDNFGDNFSGGFRPPITLEITFLAPDPEKRHLEIYLKRINFI